MAAAKIPTMKLSRLAPWLILAFLQGGASADELTLRYSRDVARRIAPLSLLQPFLPEDGRPEEGKPQAILTTRAIPLGGLDIAPERSAHRTETASTWELPPFAELDPVPGRDASEAQKKLYQMRLQEGAGLGGAPTAFSDISASSLKPSALLRPRSVLTSEKLRSQNYRVPPFFSSVRYEVPGSGYIQVSLYGGTNSFDAEEAYQALRNSVSGKESLQGYGKDAFYGTYKEELPVQPEAEKVSVATRGGVPLGDIAVSGRADSQALDPTVQAAQKAPAFRDVSTPRTAKLSGSALPAKPKQYRADQRPEYMVLVAYIPARAVTLEVAMDARINKDLQALLNLGLLISQQIHKLE